MATPTPRQIQKALKKDFDRVVGRITRADYRRAGDAVVRAMLTDVARGQSPIRGNRAFKGYINPTKYPGNRKPRTPVNLRLTGDFLDNLEVRLRRGARNPTLRIGFFRKKQILKELGHREGAGGQPKRPIIPDDKKGERFNVKISKILDRLIQDIANRAAGR